MAYQLYTSLITVLNLIINIGHLPFREHSFIWSHSLAAESCFYCVEQYKWLMIPQCVHPNVWFLQSFQCGPMRLAFSIVTRWGLSKVLNWFNYTDNSALLRSLCFTITLSDAQKNMAEKSFIAPQCEQCNNPSLLPKSFHVDLPAS